MAAFVILTIPPFLVGGGAGGGGGGGGDLFYFYFLTDMFLSALPGPVSQWEQMQLALLPLITIIINVVPGSSCNLHSSLLLLSLLM